MLLLDLNFADIAGMLDDLGDIRLVSAPYFTRNTLSKVCEASNKPILIENADTVAVGCAIIFDHAKFAVNGPKDEEDDKHVVGVPKPLVVRSARFLDGCEDHGHERNQHEIA